MILAASLSDPPPPNYVNTYLLDRIEDRQTEVSLATFAGGNTSN